MSKIRSIHSTSMNWAFIFHVWTTYLCLKSYVLNLFLCLQLIVSIILDKYEVLWHPLWKCYNSLKYYLIPFDAITKKDQKLYRNNNIFRLRLIQIFF